MLRKYKYDIAISVAEEDLAVAKAIADALKVKKIRYYLYTEHLAENVGKPLLKITLDTYGRKSQYVLMITSAVFARKYWAALEGLVTQTFGKGRNEYLLQLRLDDTAIDGLSKNLIFLPWQENAEEIAGIVSQKVTGNKRARLQKIILITAAAVVISGSTFVWQLNKITNEAKPAEIIAFQLFKKLTIKGGSDSLYKSKNTGASNVTTPKKGDQSQAKTKPVTTPSSSTNESYNKELTSPLWQKINGKKFQPVESSEEHITLFLNSNGTLSVSGTCGDYYINTTGLLKGNYITLVKGNAYGSLTISEAGVTISGRITMKSNPESGCNIVNFKIF